MRSTETNQLTTPRDVELNWTTEMDEFDSWMTRQLNCLVGRNLDYVNVSVIRTCDDSR